MRTNCQLPNGALVEIATETTYSPDEAHGFYAIAQCSIVRGSRVIESQEIVSDLITSSDRQWENPKRAQWAKTAACRDLERRVDKWLAGKRLQYDKIREIRLPEMVIRMQFNQGEPGYVGLFAYVEVMTSQHRLHPDFEPAWVSVPDLVRAGREWNAENSPKGRVYSAILAELQKLGLSSGERK